jgi:hypothetical protein
MNVRPGDLAEVIKTTDGIQVGIQVTVKEYAGIHSKLGVMWLCESSGTLVTEYGATGNCAHFADDWLRKIEPPKPIDTEVKGELLTIEYN